MLSKIGKILILFDHLKMEIPLNFLMNAPPPNICVCVRSVTHTETHRHAHRYTLTLWKQHLSDLLGKGYWDSISDFS